MEKKVAFITGASRGIGAESAVALAQAGYHVAITARTLSEGEPHDHLGTTAPLPGSLEATATAVRATGSEALCLQADILDETAMIDAARTAVERSSGLILIRLALIFTNFSPYLRVMIFTL